ncbi:MAG: zf-HC2 domain-containing protein [Planctomycetaceae bacterium]|nr:zf-HC2 domain-containing protein [Planctomycetaceae bacterium]MCA9109717.1 zf-HC2 domain-containing protein [Planctomycetaceae bacterium]
MNCKQAQHDIALWVGHDLDDASEKEAVRRHITTCPDCRTHYRQMKSTLSLLERADRPATYVSSDSLWPELATRISHSAHRVSPRSNPNRFTGWAPMIAMTAACCILLLVVNQQPQAPHQTTIRGTGVLVPNPMLTEGPRMSLPSVPSTSEQKPFEMRNAGDDDLNLKKQRELMQRYPVLDY